ncbi:hypothetical protein AVEN_204226-1, partial [Araneus ventricosus]
RWDRRCPTAPQRVKEEEAVAVSFVVGEGEVKKFIVDSGTTSHMCSQHEWFEELKPSSGTVSCAAKSRLLEVAVKQTQKAGYSVLFKDNKVIVKGKNKTFVLCELNSMGQYSVEPIGNGKRKRENVPMRMIHSDLCGPVEPATLSGERYVLTFVDDYSRFCEVRLIEKKSDIAVEFKKFLKVNDTVKRIRCDNAEE